MEMATIEVAVMEDCYFWGSGAIGSEIPFDGGIIESVVIIAGYAFFDAL